MCSLLKMLTGLDWVELNNKTEQNVTKTNKTQQNNKTFVVSQQNNKIFCSFTTKQQNSKTTKQQNNKIFCFYTTKQQNILLVHYKTTQFLNPTQQNNKIFCWFIDYPYQHWDQHHLAQSDI